MTTLAQACEAYTLAVQVESLERSLAKCNARAAELGLPASGAKSDSQQSPEFSSTPTSHLLKENQATCVSMLRIIAHDLACRLSEPSARECHEYARQIRRAISVLVSP